MFNSIILGIKQDRYRKYSEAFNFFQSKSINMIIGNRKLDYVVHYRDLEYLDDETEYFKRYYGTSETSTRIKKLINYYEINMTPPSPNLLPIHNYHILETRNRKLLKLCIMKEKSLAKRSIVHEQQDEESEGNMILSQLNNSNYSAPSSAKEEEEDNESFDSQPHNAYEIDGHGNQRNNSFVDDINLKQYADFLVLQFKMPEDPPKINIIPPVLPPPPEKITVSVAVQTLPLEPPPPKKDEKKQMEAKLKEKQREKQKEREKEKEKQREREKEREREKQKEREKQRSRQERQKAKTKTAAPQFKKQMVSGTMMSEALSNRSEAKNENVILTESIDMRSPKKEQKKKTSTFMDYYNSIPVKSPTNLLEKYIKRKK